MLSPDREFHERVGRGFCFNIEDVPFPCAENFKSLTKNIINLTEKKYADDVHRMLSNLKNVGDGHAVERAQRMILKRRNDRNGKLEFLKRGVLMLPVCQELLRSIQYKSNTIFITLVFGVASETR